MGYVIYLIGLSWRPKWCSACQTTAMCLAQSSINKCAAIHKTVKHNKRLGPEDKTEKWTDGKGERTWARPWKMMKLRKKKGVGRRGPSESKSIHNDGQKKCSKRWWENLGMRLLLERQIQSITFIFQNYWRYQDINKTSVVWKLIWLWHRGWSGERRFKAMR